MSALPKTLKGTLVVAVFLFVLLSGLAIALLVTQRYSSALREIKAGQSENLAQGIAVEAADKILINDLVGLQKMLEQQKRSHPSLAYAFILKDGQILAHTFPSGVPQGLLNVNHPATAGQSAARRIVSETGVRYLDTAWSIFEGKAGTLRLGFSESHYHRRLTALWLEIGGLTLGILVVALAGGLIFVRRITRPLAALVQATQQIDRGEPRVRLDFTGQDEIATLAAAFNQMVTRQEDYTRRLEEQTQELERAYGQARAACQVIRELSALRTFREMGALLLEKLTDTVSCRHISLAALNVRQDTLFVISAQGSAVYKDSPEVQTARDRLEGLTTVRHFAKPLLKSPVIPEAPSAGGRQTAIPFSDGHIRGAAVIACPPDCRCNPEQTQWLSLILQQNAGALGRALLQEEEISGLMGRVEAASGFGELIGKDPKMQLVYKLIEDVAASDATVLIQGESGTGKELAARAIHRLSPRQGKPFVVINCAAYPATLLESELFGHEKGAFTGATRQKPGRFELAQGGTVFLDEVGEMPPPAQIKLLRVLQSRKFERVGGEKTLQVDARLLAATNKDLLKEVERGNFREDLLYRLKVIPVQLPPLRERKNDVPLLSLHFLRRYAAEQRKDLKEISSEAMRLLLEHPWPGNVRELENSLEHAVVLAKGNRLEAWDLPATLGTLPACAPSTMEERELQTLLEILQETGWNKKLAAQRLGISRSTVYAILKRHQVSKSGPTTH
jgi:DNA-binding NtrC family response regulator/HAMP domain-containing protein